MLLGFFLRSCALIPTLNVGGEGEQRKLILVFEAVGRCYEPANGNTMPRDVEAERSEKSFVPVGVPQKPKARRKTGSLLPKLVVDRLFFARHNHAGAQQRVPTYVIRHPWSPA